jgi:hypothetical protein
MKIMRSKMKIAIKSLRKIIMLKKRMFKKKIKKIKKRKKRKRKRKRRETRMILEQKSLILKKMQHMNQEEYVSKILTSKFFFMMNIRSFVTTDDNLQ